MHSSQSAAQLGLANILRYNLQRGRGHTVPLATEVEAVPRIWRLRVHLTMDDAACRSPVPPMLLQTLESEGNYTRFYFSLS